MLKGILAISGKPGLYKMISQGKNSIIVEHLETKKRMPAYSADKVSSLEDIAIYTDEGDVPLQDVFKAIADKEEGKKAISHKSGKNEIQNYFEEILPDYDQDSVYVSDMKKVINWYNILQKLDMLDFSEEEKEEGAEKTDVSESDDTKVKEENQSDHEQASEKE